MNQSYHNIVLQFLAAVIAAAILLVWVRDEPALEQVSNDPNKVTVEYKCSEIQDYDNVPPEVVEECRKRFEQEYNLDKKPTI